MNGRIITVCLLIHTLQGRSVWKLRSNMQVNKVTRWLEQMESPADIKDDDDDDVDNWIHSRTLSPLHNRTSQRTSLLTLTKELSPHRKEADGDLRQRRKRTEFPLSCYALTDRTQTETWLRTCPKRISVSVNEVNKKPESKPCKWEEILPCVSGRHLQPWNWTSAGSNPVSSPFTFSSAASVRGEDKVRLGNSEGYSPAGNLRNVWSLISLSSDLQVYSYVVNTLLCSP